MATMLRELLRPGDVRRSETIRVYWRSAGLGKAPEQHVIDSQTNYMAKSTKKNEDILWQMLASELAMPDVQELQRFLEGEGGEHFEMGYGALSIEPYDFRGGASRMFKLRHLQYGETVISRAALRSVLHDLAHHLRR
jgi:hypothetical protein